MLISGNGDVILCVSICRYVAHSEEIHCLLMQRKWQVLESSKLWQEKGTNKSNGWELKQDKFKLEIRHTFLIRSIIVYWNKSEWVIDSSKTGWLSERCALIRWVAVLSHSGTWAKCSVQFCAVGQVLMLLSILKPSESKYLQYFFEANAFKTGKQQT